MAGGPVSYHKLQIWRNKFLSPYPMLFFSFHKQVSPTTGGRGPLHSSHVYTQKICSCWIKIFYSYFQMSRRGNLINPSWPNSGSVTCDHLLVFLISIANLSPLHILGCMFLWHHFPINLTIQLSIFQKCLESFCPLIALFPVFHCSYATILFSLLQRNSVRRK